MKAAICQSITIRQRIRMLVLNHSPLRILIFTLLALCVQPAAAGVNIQLKIDGVPGESAIRNHEGEIDLLTWSWSLQSPSSSQGNGRRRGASCSGDIEFTKYLDLASAPLLMAQLTGRQYPEVVLSVQYNTDGTTVEFLTLALSNAMVTSINTGVSTEGDGVYEQLTFAFEGMQFSYMDADGSGGQNEAVVESIPRC